MESFVFALTAISPIIIMVAVGYVLKRIGFIDGDFAKKANKLVFRLLLPSMLFLNVYNIEAVENIELGYIVYVLLAILLVFLIALPSVALVSRERGSKGALLQAIFRSNYALIGIPLAGELFGGEGVAVASVLSAFTIPLLNVLAVISLSIFNEKGKKADFKSVILEIIKNPLIVSVLLGVFVLFLRLLAEKNGFEARLSDVTPLFKVLSYLSSTATPLALLVLGAQFEFSAVPSLKKEIIFGVLARTVVVPLIGIGVAYFLFRDVFSGAHFAAFVAVFATPVAVSSVPMAQEMGGNVTLAGQLVVWTTLVSSFSVFLISFLLKIAGVF